MASIDRAPTGVPAEPPVGPRVSVVVPVRDRRDLLAELLDGLAAQTFTDFELIVIDDGSVDGSAELAEAEIREPSRIGSSVRVIRQQGAGAVAARQGGVAVALGSVLAFTDSDCVPAPGWLEAGLKAIDDGADVVMGHTRSARPRRPLERSLWAEDNGLYPTCNVFYRRDSFDHAGGFDVGLAGRYGFRPGERAKGLGFGEDTLLGWRVRRSGRASYVAEALVHHAVFPADLTDHLSRTLQAAGFPALVREVPELRTSFLHRRVFLGRSRPPLYLAVLAMAGRRRWLAAALAAWWVRLHWLGLSRNEPSRKRRILALPVVLATDAVTAGALIAGSVTTRTPVL